MDRREAKGQDDAAENTRAGDPYLLAAVLVALGFAALQLYRVASPLGGYHAFNEGFYMAQLLGDLSRNALAPLTQPQDPMNPFFYPFALSLFARVLSPSIAVARGFSILAAFATVLLTYWTGRQLYNRQIGFLACVVMAVTPGFLLVMRNIQIDPLMVALEVAAVGSYVKTVATGSSKWAALTGALCGIGLLTKLPFALIVVALALWRTWRAVGFSWLKERTTWIVGLVMLAVAVPWYVFRALGSAEFAAAQGALTESGGWRGFGYLWKFVVVEQFWMFSPVLALAVVAAVVFIATRRQDSDKLVLAVLGVHAVFYLFYNVHTYYFVPLIPFAALALGRTLWSLGAKKPWQMALAAILVLALALPFSVATLSAKKWSLINWDQMIAALERAGYRPSETQVTVWKRLADSRGPVIEYYLARSGYPAPLVVEDPFTTDVAGTQRDVVAAGVVLEGEQWVKPIVTARFEWVVPVVFGRAIRVETGAESFFTPDKTTVARVGPWWRFGVESRSEPATFEQLYEDTR